MGGKLLRTRILLALGVPVAATSVLVPGCTTKPPVWPTALPTDRACAVDDVLEEVCGLVKTPQVTAPPPFARCGTAASDLVAWSHIRIVPGTDHNDRSLAF